MKILRTPSENFLNLKDYAFKENYIEFSIKLDSDNLNVRMQMQLHKIIWGEKKGV